MWRTLFFNKKWIINYRIAWSNRENFFWENILNLFSFQFEPMYMYRADIGFRIVLFGYGIEISKRLN